jgi:type II secretory pathway pseudopilin PulG
MSRATLPRGANAAGYALLEALVAIAVVGVALLFLTGLLQHELRLDQRAREQQLALRALESALEGVRAGALPIDEPHQVYDAPDLPFVALPAGKGSRLWVDVSKAPAASPLPDLYDVIATVRFRHGPHLVERSLGTRVWMVP